MKKVLIISYYWPPSGGAAVQRWLKFSKYLRNYGWEPIIYTVENGEYPQYDTSLEKEVPEGIIVLRRAALEPYSLYKKLTGKKKQSTLQPEIVTSSSKKNSLLENFAIWVRGNFFIPDARKFWIKPSASFLKEYLKENPVDAIVSTSPPQSDHLIALELKKHFKIPWLADFRDPWTKVDYFDQLKLSKSAAAKHKALEQEVLKNADKVLTVSYAWADDFRNLGAKDVSVITNGYDTADLPKERPKLVTEFSIAHIGNISRERVHEVLFKCLSKLKKENAAFAEKFQLKLIGSVEASFMDFLKQYGLENNTSHTEAVSHKKAVEETCKAQVLLLLLGAEGKSRGRIPLKVFEYLAAQRPIIGIGPKDSDVARIISASKAGKMLGLNDENALTELLNSYFEQYQQQNLKVNTSDTEKFSREKLTGDLAGILEELTKN